MRVTCTQPTSSRHRTRAPDRRRIASTGVTVKPLSCGRKGRPALPPLPRDSRRSGRYLLVMDTWDAIRSRRAVRRFDGRPLDAAHLDRILDAGRRAGSSKNTQRWDFIVVEDRERLGALAAVGPFAGHLAGAAAAVALVTPDPRAPGTPLSVMWDLGLAAGNMSLAAWALGIGSCPATVYEQAAAREILGYPADRHCEFVLSFGYPADPEDLTRAPRPGGRRPLDEIVHRERW